MSEDKDIADDIDIDAIFDEHFKRMETDPAYRAAVEKRSADYHAKSYPGYSDEEIAMIRELGYFLEEAQSQGQVRVENCGHLPQSPLEIGPYQLQQMHMTPEKMRLLDAAARSGTRIDEPVCLRLPATRCANCGKEMSYQTFDGIQYEAIGACSIPNGKVTEIELNVPSGKMVISDNLDGFKLLGDFDTGALTDGIKTTEAMARLGCAHGYVGNSCPGIYKTGENVYAIGNPGCSDCEVDTDHPGERITSFTTDYWWYAIADYDEYLRRGGKVDRNVEVVDVKPGVYRFKHLTYLRSFSFDLDKPTTYATFEWLRDPDPLKDYLAEQRQMNFTAGQVIHNLLRNWPMMEEEGDGVRYAADFLMCVIGTGIDWHENGFAIQDPDMTADEPEIEIPIFKGKYPWYRLCEYSAISEAAHGKINLNPSFAALALNILRCMLKYGTDEEALNTHGTDPKFAQTCLELLEAKYPGL